MMTPSSIRVFRNLLLYGNVSHHGRLYHQARLILTSRVKDFISNVVHWPRFALTFPSSRLFKSSRQCFPPGSTPPRTSGLLLGTLQSCMSQEVYHFPPFTWLKFIKFTRLLISGTRTNQKTCYKKTGGKTKIFVQFISDVILYQLRNLSIHSLNVILFSCTVMHFEAIVFLTILYIMLYSTMQYQLEYT